MRSRPAGGIYGRLQAVAVDRVMAEEVTRERPDFDLLPSEYFKRQIYACFWFEDKVLGATIDEMADNLCWETDYPHPTCQHPGPANDVTEHPRAYVDRVMGHLPEETLQKVLHGNAAMLYGLE